MPQTSSTTNDTPLIEVRLCDWHLRRIFREKEIWRRFNAGELGWVPGEIRERRNPTATIPAPYNQEFIITDPATGGTQVARCHWFLAEDKQTVLASGLPDPKEITIDGHYYHGNGRRPCAHCVEGISTYSDPDVRL